MYPKWSCLNTEFDLTLKHALISLRVLKGKWKEVIARTVSEVRFRLVGGKFDIEISTIWIEFLYIQMYIETILQYSCLENPMDGGAW